MFLFPSAKTFILFSRNSYFREELGSSLAVKMLPCAHVDCNYNYRNLLFWFFLLKRPNLLEIETFLRWKVPRQFWDQRWLMNSSHYKTEAVAGGGSTASLTIPLHSVQKKVILFQIILSFKIVSKLNWYIELCLFIIL